jgi:hypothetical protein
MHITPSPQRIDVQDGGTDRRDRHDSLDDVTTCLRPRRSALSEIVVAVASSRTGAVTQKLNYTGEDSVKLGVAETLNRPGGIIARGIVRFNHSTFTSLTFRGRLDEWPRSAHGEVLIVVASEQCNLA